MIGDESATVPPADRAGRMVRLLLGDNRSDAEMASNRWRLSETGTIGGLPWPIN